MEVSGRSKPCKKTIGVAKQQSGHQKFSNFSTCKAQGNYEISIAFFEHNTTLFSIVITNKLPHSHRTSITPWKVPVKAEN